MAKVGVRVRGLWAYVGALLGSRLGMAVATLVFVAFGAHTLAAPDRFPPIGTVSLNQLGLLPPAPPKPEVALILPEQIAAYEPEIRAEGRAAAQAAKPYLVDAAQEFIARHPVAIPILNAAAAAAGFLLMIVSIGFHAGQIRKARKT